MHIGPTLGHLEPQGREYLKGRFNRSPIFSGPRGNILASMGQAHGLRKVQVLKDTVIPKAPKYQDVG